MKWVYYRRQDDLSAHRDLRGNVTFRYQVAIERHSNDPDIDKSHDRWVVFQIPWNGTIPTYNHLCRFVEESFGVDRVNALEKVGQIASFSFFAEYLAYEGEDLDIKPSIVRKAREAIYQAVLREVMNNAEQGVSLTPFCVKGMDYTFVTNLMQRLGAEGLFVDMQDDHILVSCDKDPEGSVGRVGEMFTRSEVNG